MRNRTHALAAWLSVQRSRAFDAQGPPGSRFDRLEGESTRVPIAAGWGAWDWTSGQVCDGGLGCLCYPQRQQRGLLFEFSVHRYRHGTGGRGSWVTLLSMGSEALGVRGRGVMYLSRHRPAKERSLPGGGGGGWSPRRSCHGKTYEDAVNCVESAWSRALSKLECFRGDLASLAVSPDRRDGLDSPACVHGRVGERMRRPRLGADEGRQEFDNGVWNANGFGEQSSRSRGLQRDNGERDKNNKK